MSNTAFSSGFNNLVDKFQLQCQDCLNAELNRRLLTSSTTTSTTLNYYLNEYQRCLDEQTTFANYIREQSNALDSLKTCETAIDAFLERLKTIQDYELKQNELFEQILHELTKVNPSSKEERLQLIGQIDELIVAKTKLATSSQEPSSTMNKLSAKSSDTFKNIL